MSDRMNKARKEMLQRMSSDLREKTRKPASDELKSKKMEKVTVMAPDKKGLEKGLSKAQELLRAKFGELGLPEDEMEESDEEAEACPMCGDEGCPACESDEE